MLETPDGRLYHAGDTLRWDGQAELLRRHRVDVALLPINGRDVEAFTRLAPELYPGGRVAVLARMVGTPLASLTAR